MAAAKQDITKISDLDLQKILKDDSPKDVIFEVFRRQTLGYKLYNYEEQTKTYAVAKLTPDNIYIGKVNEKHPNHAELRVIKELRDMEELETKTKQKDKKQDPFTLSGKSLLIFLNRAPCNGCAKLLTEFQTKHELSIEIKAVDAYFCGKKKKDVTSDNKSEDLLPFDGNKDVERTLNVFVKEDWTNLRNCIDQLENEGVLPEVPLYDKQMIYREKTQTEHLEWRFEKQRAYRDNPQVDDRLANQQVQEANQSLATLNISKE